MIFYINDISDSDKELTIESIVNMLNSGEYTLYDKFEYAKAEAQIMSSLAWAVYDSPVFTYKIICDDNNILQSFEKVGETGVEEDVESQMSKQEILDNFGITPEELDDLRNNKEKDEEIL